MRKMSKTKRTEKIEELVTCLDEAKADRLAKEHAEWIGEYTKFIFINGFKHGFKHAKEDKK